MDSTRLRFSIQFWINGIAIGSHTKYNGYRESILNNHSLPNGYINKSMTEKQNLQWGYVNIKPGDHPYLILNITRCA